MLSDLFQTAQLLFALILGAAILFALFHFLGWRGLVAGIAALATLFLYRKGRADGRQATIEKDRVNVERAEQTAETERVRSDLRNADPDELMRNDGFRRD